MKGWHEQKNVKQKDPETSLCHDGSSYLYCCMNLPVNAVNLKNKQMNGFV